MPSYVAAIDQGTTSTRFMVLHRAGKIVAVSQKEHQQIYPKPGWVEHDPEEIWRRTGEVIAKPCSKEGCVPRTLLPSASPTSAKRPSSGTAEPASPSPTPSFGKTPASAMPFLNLPATADRTASALKPAFPSPPTSAG